MNTQTRKKNDDQGLENLAERYLAARRVIADSGLQIKHFRPRMVTATGVMVSHLGGITVAYRQLPTDSFIELSTAVCSSRDNYHRKVGTSLAVEQFDNMHRIRVPVYGLPPHEVVERLFREYTTF